MQKKMASLKRLEQIEHGLAKVIIEQDINKAMVVQLQKALALEKKGGTREATQSAWGKE